MSWLEKINDLDWVALKTKDLESLNIVLERIKLNNPPFVKILTKEDFEKIREVFKLFMSKKEVTSFSKEEESLIYYVEGLLQ